MKARKWSHAPGWLQPAGRILHHYFPVDDPLSVCGRASLVNMQLPMFASAEPKKNSCGACSEQLIAPARKVRPAGLPA
jgi:hypothetical protein